MKKLRKIIFLGLSLTPIIATTSLIVTSCGKAKITAWDRFRDAATKDSALNIFTAAHPDAWPKPDANSAAKLTIGSFKINNQQKIISVDITYQLNSYTTSTGVFQILFKNKTYSKWNWIIASHPKTNHDWSLFKHNALAVTPADLLKTVKSQTSVWNSLKWSVGTPQQTVWSSSAVAEFDIYGSVDKSDPYQGMQGKPTADETAKTITAIISIKNKNGAYDSNPIKAVIHYNDEDLYNIENWAFSKDSQSQSFLKYSQLAKVTIDKVKAAGKNFSLWSTFFDNNWMNPQHSINVTSWLNANQAPKVYASLLLPPILTKQALMVKGKQTGWLIIIKFRVGVTYPDNSTGIIGVTMNNDFLFHSNADRDYGSCFSSTWTGSTYKPLLSNSNN